MTLLLDANLSWRLCQKLSQYFPGIRHVKDIGIATPSTDDAIWEYAAANQCCIVTNDEDFLNILLKRGFPPKLVLLKMGNQSTKAVEEVLMKHVADISALEGAVDFGFLEIYG